MSHQQLTKIAFLIVYTAVLVLCVFVSFTVGRMVGEGEGWREKTEQVEASYLPTGSQIETMAQACIDNHKIQ